MSKSRVIGIFENLFLLLLIFLLISFSNVRGGIDYDVYLDVTNQFSLSFYYISNIVSWSSIYMARIISGSVAGIALIITYFLYLCSVLFERPNNNTKSPYFLFLALASPIGVLLSLNVLRQYIALVFMFLAFYFWCKDKKYRGFLFLIISLLSHQVTFFFAAMFFAHKNINRYALALAITISLVLISLYGPEFASIGDDSVKLLGYIFYSLILLVIYCFTLRLTSVDTFYDKLDIERYLSTVFIYLLLFSFMTDIPVWGLNRLWIAYGFLILLLLYSIKSRRFGKMFFLKFFVLVFNLVALNFHEGARGML